MKRLTLEEFGGEKYYEKGKQNTWVPSNQFESIEADYQKYLRLTDKEIERFHMLSEHIGEDVILDRGRAVKSKMYIACVQLNPDEKHTDPRPYDYNNNPPIYRSNPYCIRLNYRDKNTNTTREWDGVWISNPMKITLESKI